jgi:LemA protein
MEGKYIVVGVLVVLLIFGLWVVGIYNGLVTLDNTCEEKWAQVENQYQRRADLIPNLVNTVKGYAAHEQQLFTEVTNLRSQWASAVSSGDRSAQIEAARGMDSAISRLLLVAENYPDLKASQNFLALQSQLEGTENRIAVERMRYNEVVRQYNIKIKKIPDRFIANLAGYTKKDYFEADPGTQTVPNVEF